MPYFSNVEAEHLRKLRAQVATAIPGDGAWQAAVSSLLTMLIDSDLVEARTRAHAHTASRPPEPGGEDAPRKDTKQSQSARA
jgi:hypothetical protein